MWALLKMSTSNWGGGSSGASYLDKQATKWEVSLLGSGVELVLQSINSYLSLPDHKAGYGLYTTVYMAKLLSVLRHCLYRHNLHHFRCPCQTVLGFETWNKQETLFLMTKRLCHDCKSLMTFPHPITWLVGILEKKKIKPIVNDVQTFGWKQQSTL